MDENSLGKNMLIASFNIILTIILCIVVKNFILKD